MLERLGHADAIEAAALLDRAVKAQRSVLERLEADLRKIRHAEAKPRALPVPSAARSFPRLLVGMSA
jgi:hypothetical protein